MSDEVEDAGGAEPAGRKIINAEVLMSLLRESIKIAADHADANGEFRNTLKSHADGESNLNLAVWPHIRKIAKKSKSSTHDALMMIEDTRVYLDMLDDDIRRQHSLALGDQAPAPPAAGQSQPAEEHDPDAEAAARNTAALEAGIKQLPEGEQSPSIEAIQAKHERRKAQRAAQRELADREAAGTA